MPTSYICDGDEFLRLKQRADVVSAKDRRHHALDVVTWKTSWMSAFTVNGIDLLATSHSHPRPVTEAGVAKVLSSVPYPFFAFASWSHAGRCCCRVMKAYLTV